MNEDEKDENRNVKITTIVCVSLFLIFIFLSALMRDTDNIAFMKACAGFAVGFLIARMYASTLVAKTRERVASHYSYYENMYNRYLKSKLKSYIIKYKAKEDGRLLIMGDDAMNEEEVILNFNAFKNSMSTAWRDAKIVEISEGEFTKEYIENFQNENEMRK